MLVVVRDVEKESEIESEGLQKKGNFFQKTRFAIAKMAENACFACVTLVFCVLCVLRALRVALRVFAARKVLRTVVCYSFSHGTFIFSGRKSGV